MRMMKRRLRQTTRQRSRREVDAGGAMLAGAVVAESLTTTSWIDRAFGNGRRPQGRQATREVAALCSSDRNSGKEHEGLPPRNAAKTRHEPRPRPTPLGAEAMALAFRTNSYAGENPRQFRSSEPIRQWSASHMRDCGHRDRVRSMHGGTRYSGTEDPFA